MRFWDSSAIVPLILEEGTSPACRRLFRSDKAIAVWALSKIEVLSAVWRHHRAGELDRNGVREAIKRLGSLAKYWTEVESLEPVRVRAERLIAVHPLRAADTLQLAAALVIAKDRPIWPFVTADEQLAAMAELEGFDVIIPAR